MMYWGYFFKASAVVKANRIIQDPLKAVKQVQGREGTILLNFNFTVAGFWCQSFGDVSPNVSSLYF